VSDIVVYLCILYFLLVLLVSPRPISTARDCLHVRLLRVLHALTCIFCKSGMLHAVSWQFRGTDFGKRKCHTLRSLDSEFMNIWRQKERNRKRRSTLQSDTVITMSDRSASYYMSWLFFLFSLLFWIIVILKIVHIWNWLSFHSVGSMWKYMSLHFQYICVW